MAVLFLFIFLLCLSHLPLIHASCPLYLVGGGSDESHYICARVCLVNEDENVIFHTYVEPLMPVTDYRDLSFNDFSGNILVSSTSMKYLCHLPVGNVFTSLEDLGRMDLSSNKFTTTGDLIQTSFQDLKNLSALELNYPAHLVGWKSTGGDPCQESWKGISCNGSSVIFIDLSFNDFSGNIWPSLASMKYLCHLPVGNVFTSLEDLGRMDLSSNKFTTTGNLILTSFQDLKNLTALDLSFNDFSGNILVSSTSMKYLCHLNLSTNSSSGPVGNVALIIVSNDDTSAAASQEVGPWHGILLLLCFLFLATQAAAAAAAEQQQQQQQQPNDDQPPNHVDQGAVVEIEQQQEPEEQQPGDQGAVVVVNEGENSWCQETDSNFRRDGRRESKEVRAKRHWRKHPKKEKK